MVFLKSVVAFLKACSELLRAWAWFLLTLAIVITIVFLFVIMPCKLGVKATVDVILLFQKDDVESIAPSA